MKKRLLLLAAAVIMLLESISAAAAYETDKYTMETTYTEDGIEISVNNVGNSSIFVYTAYYKNRGALLSVSCRELKSGKTTLTSEIPYGANAVKTYLWDENMTPLTEDCEMDLNASKKKYVEYLDRGTYAAALQSGGVYVSWRLLGTEAVNQTFDIYKNGELSVSEHDGTCYVDEGGTAGDCYGVAPAGDTPDSCVYPTDADKPYFEIAVRQPEGGIGDDGNEYTYVMTDGSVGDVDGDGVYEYFIKWEPTNRKDNSENGITANTYFDCYNLDGDLLWRIDMGINIRSGSHYSPFMVYDFDCDGKCEMAVRTTCGSKDGAGNYVSAAGENLIWHDSATGEIFDDESDMRNSDGHIIKGPDWLTMFDGKTGKAIETVNYFSQRGDTSDWGDKTGNRSERFLAAVAYIDGVHPSLIESRGYYKKAAMAAYDWDGEHFILRWERTDTEKGGNLYGNGNHQMSVCDADNDKKDELVFGSTVVDDDGGILNSTDHGHGDALHVSDFDNDGCQEIFQVHEEQYEDYGVEVRRAGTGEILAAVSADGDVGRGLMANLDDTYGSAIFFTSADSNMYDMNGSVIAEKPKTDINPSFVIYWDGDLSREIHWKYRIFKYTVESGEMKVLNKFSDVTYVSKEGPLIQGDLFGDWREEAVYPSEKQDWIRIYFTNIKTDYKLPTLMHDTQYRCAVAWQNSAYNQPPHTRFYIGEAALDNDGYLNPAAGFDKVIISGR